MIVKYLNLNQNDVKLNKKTIRLKIDKDTFLNGKTPVKLTPQNIKDINDGKSYITIKPSQGVITEKDAKHGGALPLLALIPAAAALFGGVASGASSIATAVKNSKKLDKELEEQKRHNLAMEEAGQSPLKQQAAAKTGSGFILKRPRIN